MTRKELDDEIEYVRSNRLKKSLLLSVIEIRGYYYVCAHDNNYFMKKEEAESIKEVIKNE